MIVMSLQSFLSFFFRHMEINDFKFGIDLCSRRDRSISLACQRKLVPAFWLIPQLIFG